MNIPFLKPKMPKLFSVKEELKQVYDSYQFSNNGKTVKKLENKIKSICGFDGDVISFANGTLTLMVALRASGAKNVIVPGFTFPATIQACKWNNLTIHYADIDSKTWTLDPDHVEEIILEFKDTGIHKIDTVVPVHSFGNPCDVEKFEMLKNIHGVNVIYDAAPSIGSFVKQGENNKHIGFFGDMSSFSLHATKILPAGEGGVLFVKDLDMAKKIRRLINFGQNDNKEVVEEFGLNAKMQESSACFAVAGLDNFALNQKRRFDIVDKYKSGLHGTFQESLDGHLNSHQTFQILIPDQIKNKRDAIIDYLNDKGVECRKYYSPPMHKIPCLNSSHKMVDLNITESVSSRIISLPLHLWMSDNEVKYVIDSYNLGIKFFLENK